jgi:transcription-repair coupling factor (superfamily II helicase)
VRLAGLLPAIRENGAVASLRERLRAEALRETAGVPDAAKPALLAALLAGAPEPVLIVTPRPARAAALVEELALLLPETARLLVFPEIDTIPYERVSADAEAAEARLKVLQALALADRDGLIVVTSGMALAQRTLAPQAQRSGLTEIAAGGRIGVTALLARLDELGYALVPQVETPGEASRRGGIVDIFPPGADLPVRIELFGDEVETLRTFDLATQRTVARIERIAFGPAREAAGNEAVERLLAGLDLDALPDEVRARFSEEAEQLRNGNLQAGGGLYLPFLTTASLLDHLPAASLLVVDERADLAHALDELDEQAVETRGDLETRGLLPPGFPLPHATRADVLREIDGRARTLALHRWAADAPEPDGDETEPARLFGAAMTFGGRLRQAATDLDARAREGGRVVVTSQQSARLAEVLRNTGREVAVVRNLEAAPPPGAITLVTGSAGAGWTLDLPDGRLYLFTDSEVFGFTKVRRPQRARASNREAFLADLAPGDFVVHIEHGIGHFKGLIRRDVDGVQREYLELSYADNDRLLVPTDQVDRVSRYVGPSDHAPQLTRLGTAEWQRLKDRVRRAVTDLAQELLNLYAQREVTPGHAYSPDGPWQQELEASFPFVETPDQLRAIAEIKHDMEEPRPMDRVVVGDVGYGKTEIAIRAAFKAVLDGVQVAVLAPTTVLAQQHMQTFRERLGSFPTKIEVLSRFRAEKDQREVVAALAQGDVDILIGTHRLLQKDVVFKDLGLVIVDEEQRFGVAHKEWLKRQKQSVDVLTLSATPIPRTLNMALSGIRDLSTLATAPEERLPIKTYVAEFDERLVREAILRELDRGGQIYFVHNRVQSIDRIAGDIRRVVPEAQVAVGHGQMAEGELEKVMAEFQRGGFDVLVCTTIIESGLDIPSVNTILINNADRFGLAQLYQLRGRVGRGANRAYCYLLFDRNKALTEVAQKRLEVIFEATELGAGFQIALRDLEIRGAGNLLGAEQSGQIGAVGFDLYSKMLGDAVGRMRAAMRGEQPPAPTTQLPPVQVDLPLAAYIPESYVDDLHTRLALYQRMGSLSDAAEAQALADELADRFGPPPPAVINLLYILAAKSVARAAGVLQLVREEGRFVVRLAAPLSEESRRALRERFRGAIEVGSEQLRLRESRDWPAQVYALLALVAGVGDGALPAFAAGRVQPGEEPVAPAPVPTPDGRPNAWQKPAARAAQQARRRRG